MPGFDIPLANFELQQQSILLVEEKLHVRMSLGRHFDADHGPVFEFAGQAIGSKMGFIYLRGEYRYLLKIMEKAIDDAYAKGFLGKNIFGSNLDFDVISHTGAGAYEVGEESALVMRRRADFARPSASRPDQHVRRPRHARQHR